MGNSDSLLQCLLFFPLLLPAIWFYCSLAPPKELEKIKPGSQAPVEQLWKITYWDKMIFNVCSPLATDNKETALRKRVLRLGETVEVC